MSTKTKAPVVGASLAVRAIAAELGEDASRILVREGEWRQYLQDGLTVKLTVGRWRAKAQLTLADLGIFAENDEQAKVYERILDPGTRYLLPREVMKQAETLESKARYALEKRSFPTF